MDQDLNNLVKVDQYRRCLSLLQKRCEVVQKENERLVHRLFMVKRITKRRNKELCLLKTRLDLYNDSWRTAQPEPLLKLEKHDIREFITQSSNPKTNLPNKNNSGKKTKSNNNGNSNTKGGNNNNNSNVNNKPAPGTKRKRTKGDKEKDPNAPKRPANPFFQFCQEQRSVIMDEMNSELQPGEPEPSKQELTRQLAQRWRMMDNNDKQVYINMYESSKMKYNQEMLTYKKDTAGKEKKPN